MNLADLIVYMDDVAEVQHLSGNGHNGDLGPFDFWLLGMLVPAEVGGVLTDDADASVAVVAGGAGSDQFWLDVVSELTTAGRVCAYRRYDPGFFAVGEDVAS